MRKILAWVLCLLCVLSFSGCAQEQVRDVPALLEPVGVKISTAIAQRNTIYSVDSYDGQIAPHVEELSFEIDGKIKEVFVQAGDWVEAGQVLATLDTQSLEKQIDALDDDIYEISMMGKYSDQQATADIEIAKVQLAQMREEGASEQKCAEKELEIHKLELSLKQTQELRNMQLNTKYVELDKMEEQLQKNQLVAPFEGRIVHLGTLAPGKSVKELSPVIYIADESRLVLQIGFQPEYVFENADKVYAHIMDGVYDISYIPYDKQEYVKMVLSGEEMKTQFAVDAKPGELESGQFAVVLVLTNYKEDALTIPLNAVYRDKDGRHVYKLVDGQRVRCEITIGMITDTSVEVLEGLTEGDVVCVDN